MADEKPAEKPKIRIGSSLPQAVSLTCDVPGIDSGGGVRFMVPNGPPVIVAGTETPDAVIEDGVAVTEVDEEFFTYWVKQNQGSPLAGAIAPIKPRE